jgi:hypothetical protein
MKGEKCCSLLQVVFKAILMISAIIFFIIHVKGVFEKYVEKRTNYSMKKDTPGLLKPPAFTICLDPAFKYGSSDIGDLSFGVISNNDNLFANVSVWEVFTNFTYILNRDFIFEFSTGDPGEFSPKNLKLGANTFEGNTQKQKGTVNVNEMYTQQSGICYTIASQIPLDSTGYVDIQMIFSPELTKNQLPKMVNIFLTLDEERYGVLQGTWPGVSPKIINVPLGTYVGMIVEKKEWHQIGTKYNVNCTVYGNNDTMARCNYNHFARQFMNSSVCDEPCIPVTMKSAYEIIDSVTDSNKCKTVEQNNYVMMSCNNYRSPCLPSCNTVEFNALYQKTQLRSRQDSLQFVMLYTIIEVTVYAEYLVYDFLNFVGSVGGSLGLFIGFSYFDFGTLAIGAIKRFCKN